jgi:RNA polymerase sigma-70 factor (ECF subfamily)
MKKTYEEFVTDNSPWLLQHVKAKLKHKSLAEDIVQEIFVKVFRAYDSYTDEGKEKSWLMRIAKTTLCDYFSEKGYNEISYEALTENGERIFENNYYDSVEEKYIQQEFINEILAVVAKMTAIEQSVFQYRFLMEYSASETAEILGIPSGSVKSKTFYIKRKLQNEFKMNEINERKIIMNCKDFELYLLGYAKNLKNMISKKDLINHIDSCPKCSAIVSSLKRLVPHLPEQPIIGKEIHVLIVIPDEENELDYCYVMNQFNEDEAEKLNARTEKLKKMIDENKLSYHKWANPNIFFDNEGNEYKCVLTDNNQYATVRKFYTPIEFDYSNCRNAMFCKPDRDYERPSADNPNLMECRLENNFGPEVFSSLYMALPKTAKNIHMIRGNGVIDCGEYLFAYVSRHVAEGERIVVEYTYEKN